MSSPKRVAKRKKPEGGDVTLKEKAASPKQSPAKLKRENTMVAVVKEGSQFLDRTAAGSPAKKRTSSRLAAASSSPRPAKRARKTKAEEKKEKEKEEEEEEEEEELNDEAEADEEGKEGGKEKTAPPLLKGASMLKVAKEAQHFLVKGSGSPLGKTRSQSARAKRDEEEEGKKKKKKKPTTPRKLVKQSTMTDTTKEGENLLKKAGGSPATRLRPNKGKKSTA